MGGESGGESKSDEEDVKFEGRKRVKMGKVRQPKKASLLCILWQEFRGYLRLGVRIGDNESDLSVSLEDGRL